MLSLTTASTTLAMATAGVEEVVLLTYNASCGIMAHGIYVTFYPLHIDLAQPLSPLSGRRHVHELMFSKLPCFIMAEHGRFLAWILAYVSHTKHTCLGC